MLDELLLPRKLNFEQARQEQRAYWAAKSMPERLAAAAALTERMYRMRGVDPDEWKADWTVRRVRRSQG